MYTAAWGGMGGRGNASYRSKPGRPAPRLSQPGEPGVRLSAVTTWTRSHTHVLCPGSAALQAMPGYHARCLCAF